MIALLLPTADGALMTLFAILAAVLFGGAVYTLLTTPERNAARKTEAGQR